MKHIISNQLFVFLLLLILSSCNWYSDCNKVDVSETLNEWAECYNVGDTIILESNLNNYDSLIVTSKESKYSPCNKFELGPNQNQTISVSLRSILKEVDTCRNQLLKAGVGLTLFSEEIYRKEFKRLSVYNLHSGNKKCESEKTDSTKKCENPVWMKTPYFKDSIFAHKYDTNNARYLYDYVNSEYSCAIKSFHWSKEYGLVQYETEDSELYQLINRY